jgi:hypothetical protein
MTEANDPGWPRECMRTSTIATLFVLGAFVCACAPTKHSPVDASPTVESRTFVSGFESLGDFAGMYISPQTATTRHALVSSPRHGGERAHCAWLMGRGTGVDTDGPNHRGYPTVQLRKIDPRGFATPGVVDLWVWVDAKMRSGQWLSLATLSPDPSDRWTRVVTVNLHPGGWVDVYHVPDQGEHRPTIETHRAFPQRQWVHLSIRIDFDPQHGSVEVLQNNELVAAAKVNGGHGRLEQAHFGMYAISSLTSATVCNDDLKISSH